MWTKVTSVVAANPTLSKNIGAAIIFTCGVIVGRETKGMYTDWKSRRLAAKAKTAQVKAAEASAKAEEAKCQCHKAAAETSEANA